jgi:hypothetical protein
VASLLTDHFDGRNGINYNFGQFVLKWAGCCKGAFLLHGCGNGNKDVVIGVPQDGRSPGSDVVNVIALINVPGAGALDTIKDNWVTSDDDTPPGISSRPPRRTDRNLASGTA